MCLAFLFIPFVLFSCFHFSHFSFTIDINLSFSLRCVNMFFLLLLLPFFSLFLSAPSTSRFSIIWRTTDNIRLVILLLVAILAPLFHALVFHDNYLPLAAHYINP